MNPHRAPPSLRIMVNVSQDFQDEFERVSIFSCVLPQSNSGNDLWDLRRLPKVVVSLEHPQQLQHPEPVHVEDGGDNEGVESWMWAWSMESI